MELLYKNVLQLTEDIEICLERGGSDISPLLSRWQKAFSQLPGAIPHQDLAGCTERIIACQERCVRLAMEKKKELQIEMQETRNRKKLHQAYGKHAVLR
ncbi:MAG: hypothetical protein H8E41_04965 [Desulfobulbaceae bacterium]|uniref:Flagellar protein FliT n=1 Tax=Candidatus Desulfobia pelagia TaxID=2841692 RepID=A0A8J6NE76_9BACT|nr:hypothetical protein [Candidatus Desulfobia pelagia]